MAPSRIEALRTDLQAAIDRDPQRPGVYVNRATLREFLALTAEHSCFDRFAASSVGVEPLRVVFEDD